MHIRQSEPHKKSNIVSFISDNETFSLNQYYLPEIWRRFLHVNCGHFEADGFQLCE